MVISLAHCPLVLLTDVNTSLLFSPAGSWALYKVEVEQETQARRKWICSACNDCPGNICMDFNQSKEMFSVQSSHCNLTVRGKKPQSIATIFFKYSTRLTGPGYSSQSTSFCRDNEGQTIYIPIYHRPHHQLSQYFKIQPICGETRSSSATPELNIPETWLCRCRLISDRHLLLSPQHWVHSTDYRLTLTIS